MLADVHRSRGKIEGSGSDEGNQPVDHVMMKVRPMMMKMMRTVQIRMILETLIKIKNFAQIDNF